MKICITLNGTDSNPYLRHGLTRNPFPVIPKAEYQPVNDALNRLAAEPLKGTDDIIAILGPVVRGAAGDDLIALCCEMFKPGEIVSFNIIFPE